MKTYGKIILIGEHSVVYNHKAIAIPFRSGYVETTLTKHKKWCIDSVLFKGDLEDIDPELEHLRLLLLNLREVLELPPLKVQLKSTLPISSGLGSSAAVAASVTKAIYKYKEKELSMEALFEHVQFSERIAHGVSSGIDTLIITAGKGYIFSRDGEKQALNYDLDAYLIIGNSKQKGSTKLAVDTVKYHVQSKNGKRNIDVLGEFAGNFYDALINKNVNTLGIIMNQAHSELKALGLETEVLNTMVTIARKNGALGAKLTGAGLGGCVIALSDNKATAHVISNAWEKQGFDSWIMDMKEAM